MAQTLSTAADNASAMPRTLAAKVEAPAPKYEYSDTVAVPDTANNDTIICKPISVDAIPSRVTLSVSDCGSAGTMSVGMYYVSYPGGTRTFTAVDDDCICATVDISTSVGFSAAPARFAGLAADGHNKTLWEIAGLSSRPAYDQFYVGLKTPTGTTTTGTATIHIEYR